MGQVGITAMGVNQMGYHFREGFRNFFSHGLMSFAATCMIVACLLIMGSFSLVAVNIDNMLRDLEKDNEFLAFIDETLSEDEARALQGSIEAVPNVAEVNFISREQAKAAFLEDKDPALFRDIPDGTFRHRFSVHVEDLNLMGETAQAVKELPGVEDIRVELEIAQGFVMLRNVAGALAIILVVMLVVVSLFIISNTIRITTFTRREEIAIMKMCGATDWFIRWPFLVEGLIIGLLGALIAFGLQWSVYGILHTAVGNVTNLQFVSLVPFQDMMRWVLSVFLGAGFLIGAGGSALAIRKFLRV